MATYKPPLVFTVHGIRTRGEWQKRLADILSTRGIPTRSYDYGHYNLPRFLIPPLNDRMIDRFYEEYQKACLHVDNKVVLADYSSRPSVIAHSFGTYIVGYCLQKYEDVKFDKVIFCGSVLPEDFDWSTLMQRDQVFLVRNEFGLKDVWTKIVGMLVRRTGQSGAQGFDFRSNNLEQHQLDYFHHSDFFREGHIREYWLPFLTRDPFPLRVKHGRDITDPEEFGTMLDITRETLVKVAYRDLPHFRPLPLGRSRSWIAIEPDIYTFLVDPRENPSVKAYINAMPVEPEVFARIRQGRLDDSEVTADHIAPYVSGGDLHLYLMSVVIGKEARKYSSGLVSRALEKLLYGIVDKLVYYKVTHGVRVSQILSVGWTPEGRKLCRLIGMKQTGEDQFGNPIFWADLQNPDFLTKRQRLRPLERLADVYRS